MIKHIVDLVRGMQLPIRVVVGELLSHATDDDLGVTEDLAVKLMRTIPRDQLLRRVADIIGKGGPSNVRPEPPMKLEVIRNAPDLHIP